MDSDKIEALEKRLATFERSNRRWKAFGLLGAGSLAGLLVVGWGPDKKGPQPAEAQQVVIKKDGKVAVLLDPSGLYLFGSDQQGNEMNGARASLGVESDNSGAMHIRAKGDGKAQINFVISQQKGGMVEVKNNAGKEGQYP